MEFCMDHHIRFIWHTVPKRRIVYIEDRLRLDMFTRVTWIIINFGNILITSIFQEFVQIAPSIKLPTIRHHRYINSILESEDLDFEAVVAGCHCNREEHGDIPFWCDIHQFIETDKPFFHALYFLHKISYEISRPPTKQIQIHYHCEPYVFPCANDDGQQQHESKRNKKK